MVYYGCQGYFALKFHMEEALIENGKSPNSAIWNPKIALFSKKYVNKINAINCTKIHDFCFIGSIDYKKTPQRKWVVDFAKKYFTKNSIFINTDTNPSWISLGEFDYSGKGLGYRPREHKNNQSREAQYREVEENEFYFTKMKQSRFILCPSGDAPWSFRFYETLMCKSIPIVENNKHTYRTKEESNINYKFIFYNKKDLNIDINYNEYIDENTKLFEQYHMLN